MFQAIIFDMDGLMVDTEPLYWDVGRQLVRRFGTTVKDQTLRRMMGRSRLDSMRIFADECAITQATPEQLLAERERLMLERYQVGVEPMPGLLQFIDHFHSLVKLAVATSSPRKFTDVLLPALGIADRFDVIQAGDDVVHGKPDPEIYLKAIARLDVAAEQCVVLEDSHAGALAGHRAGAYVIAVPSELTASEDFSFADQRVANLFEAESAIDRLKTRRAPSA